MRQSRLVFLDETGFDVFLYREYARAPMGEKIYEKVSGKRFERQSVVAAKCGKEILAPFGYTGTCNADLFNFWLKTQLIPTLKKGQVVIMDNASIHKTETTREIIRDAGCHLVFLPAHSPDLNPIEKIWAHKKHFIKTNMKKFTALIDAIAETFSK